MRRSSIGVVKKYNPLIFFVLMCFVTAVGFQSYARLGEIYSEDDPAGDRALPEWCPPAKHPGLAVICGTVVSAGIVEYPANYGSGLQQPNVPIDNVMVAVYEENPDSPTGKLDGYLTNIFSSTTTNKMGRYRIEIRRVKPPNLIVHLVFFCGGTVAEHEILDSWHNTHGHFTQIECEPSFKTSGTNTAVLAAPPTPPFPLDYAPRGSFLGCENKPFEDISFGLSKREQPTINNLIGENNYDHRFNLNTVNVIMPQTFLGEIPPLSFTSPGGLWEPDCLLRNEAGIYMCDSLSCGDVVRGGFRYQPCDLYEGEWEEYSGSKTPYPGEGLGLNNCRTEYSGVKLYGRADCTADPNTGLTAVEAGSTGPNGEISYLTVDECNAVNAGNTQGIDPGRLPRDKIDKILCDSGSDDGTIPPSPMGAGDYITRPFFKFIPKSIDSVSEPFRRFESRNDTKNFMMQIFTPVQLTQKLWGHASNSDSSPIVSARPYMAPPTTLPDLPTCDYFLESNEFVARGKVNSNKLITNGPLSALGEKYGTIEDIYYSGQKDLSDPVCLDDDGDEVRLCEIQLPWGEGSLCDPNEGGCKDPNLRSRLNKSLSGLTKPGVKYYTEEEMARIQKNLENSLAFCGGEFKYNKRYFPTGVMLGDGDTQMGFHSQSPNDSIPSMPDRATPFEQVTANQLAQSTGERAVIDEGGKFGANSITPWATMTDPQWATNDPNARNVYNVLTEPYLDTYEEYRKRYRDPAPYTIQRVGSSQTSYCVAPNVYSHNITPEMEMPLIELIESTEDVVPIFFNNLFTGNGLWQQGRNPAFGTTTWFMSETAILRDTALNCTGIPVSFEYFQEEIRVGTSMEPPILDQLAFGGICQRNVWDGLLSYMGGDAGLHGMNVSLGGILKALVAAGFKAEAPWKSFLNREEFVPEPLAKPYYQVKWAYPLDENSFKSFFKLPSPYSDLEIGDWGPGHLCYNFDKQVPEGQICGTYRENPEGLSRTCRVDQCVNFNRVESVKCVCKRDALAFDANGEPYLFSAPRCGFDDRTDKHLVISDCSREQKAFCGIRQETTKAWSDWPDGYPADNVCIPTPNGLGCRDYSPYYRDLRSGEGTNGVVMPPDDIDMPRYEDDDEADTAYDAPYIDEFEIRYSNGQIVIQDNCTADMFDWDNTKLQQSQTIFSGPGEDRPRCWVSVAGPYRRNPNFTAVGQEVPEAGSGPGVDGAIKNCNGYLEIEDFALRATQSEPFPALQTQLNVDKSSDIVNVIDMSLKPPYQPGKTGNTVISIDGGQTNALFGQPGSDKSQNYFVLGQHADTGGCGDCATFPNRVTAPSVVTYTAADMALLPMYFHCDLLGYSIEPEPGDAQLEVSRVLRNYDPEDDGLMGWTCEIVNPPSPQVPELQPTAGAGSCTQVSNWSTCQSKLKEMIGELSGDFIAGTRGAGGPPALTSVAEFNLSSSFRNTIGWAAQQADIPAGALIAVLMSEGGFSPGNLKYWNDSFETFKMGVPWWGQMTQLGGPSTCNNLVWTAQGPYQIIKHWVKVLLESQTEGPQFCSALGGNRCESILNAGRCNFADASMIAAWFLRSGGGGTCSTGFNINAALAGYSGGSYATEGVNTGSLIELYNACR